jgi:hypothetical protein
LILEIDMKRGFIVLGVCALICGAYFTASKWAIRHTTLTFVDPVRSDAPSPSTSPSAAIARSSR